MKLDIHIIKDSEVTIREQLVEQIIFLIATGKLQPGEALPSVRGLARPHKIHHNTISQAYQDLVDRDWLIRRRGSRMVVRSPGEREYPPPGLKTWMISSMPPYEQQRRRVTASSNFAKRLRSG